MRRRRSYLDYLRDMLEASTHAEQFLGDMSVEDFAANTEKVFAVSRALQIIGEAARNIPPAVQSTHSSIPWSQIMGMRHKIVHHYFGTDAVVVWHTVKDDLPSLRMALLGILRETEDQ